VTRGRHSLVPTTLRSRRTALLAAPLVTALAIGAGLATSGFDVGSGVASADARSGSAAAGAATTLVGGAPAVQRRELAASRSRQRAVSRSSERTSVAKRRTPPAPRATGTEWTTAPLKLRVLPREGSRDVGVLASGKQVAVTGGHRGDYAEVVVGRAARWVTAAYLSKHKVVAPKHVGLSDAPCPDGSGIESALQPQSVKVYRAVCAAFPELTSYGGQDGHGEHVNGEAIDFMVPSSGVGERVKDFLYAHHSELDLFDIIWSQHIWTIQRAGEGFRSMEDRGSATANHYDHVHIKIN
jgi:hypothetical protein